MGQARIKERTGIKPQHYAGPHGHSYYCQNRCGEVVFRKSTNETFVERPVAFWGWCAKCKRDFTQQEALLILSTILADCKTQVEALHKISRGVVLSDGLKYNLSEAMKSMADYSKLPSGVEVPSASHEIVRCHVIFRHAPHDACDGNPTGLIDPAVGMGSRT